MKKAIVLLAALGFCAAPAFAAVGDWWILPVDRLDQNFTTHVGAGYDGTDAYEGNAAHGQRRVWWNTNNVYDSSPGAAYPTGPELFTVEFWSPNVGPGDWQPIEVEYNGYVGDAFPMEPNIPWNGQFGTNHQWLGSEFGPRNQWIGTGPGPQGPNSTDPDAPGDAPDSIYMWMTGGSVLYAKWDYPWDINRSWSMVRITQITPEPGAALLLLLGAPMLLGRRRRA